MPGLSSFTKPGPYHILAYGTLFGTNIFQSFIGGIMAFKVLPRAQFAQLQKALFPIYFSIQTVIPLILAITYPLPSQTPGSSTSSLTSVLFDPFIRNTVLIPLVTMFVCGLANWSVIGPMTTKVMQERKHQETRDGKKYFDAGPHSEEMKKLNSRFGALHGISSLVNVMAILASVRYGWVLGNSLA